MATGDVTKYGPYNIGNLDDVKANLEAGSVVVADKVFVAQISETEFYIFRIEA